MNHKIYEFLDYKKALRADIKNTAPERGYQARLARAAGCQSSFLSQVLNSHVHLTLDHAIGISNFWKLSQDSEDYFLHLVEHARAATPALRSYLQRKLDDLRKTQEDISQRMQQEELNNKTLSTLYYSAWYLLAIHVAINIPSLQSEEALAERLRLPEDLIQESLKKLAQMGLIQRQGKNWVSTKRHLHLPRNSTLIDVHHSHWRLRAIENAQMKNLEDMHYSTVMALSRDDFRKIKTLLISLVEKSKEILAPSKEEELVCLNLDCFKI